MKYYAVIDAEGCRIATYLPDDRNRPEDAIEIDEATFRDWINNHETRRWDRAAGHLVEVAAAPRPPEPTPAEIVERQIARSPALSAIVEVLAERFNVPHDDVLSAVKAKARARSR